MEQKELIKIIEEAARKRAKTLNLSNMGITELPEQIGQLVKLRELQLLKNKLRTLPKQIGQLVNLELLEIYDNQLSTLPEQIGQLVNLRKLNLGRNQLRTLPEQIGQLASLRNLELRENRLSTLPEQFGQLSNLEYLEIHGNRLERLPRSIGDLKQLGELYIGYTRNNLGNPLIELPAETQNLTNLRNLYLYNCPRLNLPPEIVAKENSPQEILDYYFRTRTQPSGPLNEAKVLVVGEAEVGKTSLIKQLLEIGDFDPGESQTHGIITHRWDLPIEKKGKKKKRTVRLNVWDFGGQEIMHATHQFFLTKRSLYVLVLDSRQNERQSRIEYWLKLIHSFGEESPVIVVCNKCDQQIMQLDWQGLQAKYPQIRRYVREVSCAKKIGVQEVSAAIKEEIARLEHVETIFPETWFEVKQKLEDSTESCMPYPAYIGICKDRGITEEKEQRQLIGFLNDLGIVLHFHDHPILRDLNILNPLWVTMAVYRILTSPHLAQAHGVLTFAELGTLLEAVAEKGFKYPPERQMFVIEMMRRFELLFDFEGQANQKFLLPGLLPMEQPADLDTDWEDALGFRYQYEVLPGSVISRFIVRMHPWIYEEFYWRKGVLLQSLDGDVQARVQADFEDERIDIHIRGRGNRRRFLQSIRDQFDAIHVSIPRIGVREEIPLPEHPEVRVPYNKLLKFEENGLLVDHILVGDNLVQIQVNELLEGIRHPAGLDVFISYAHDDSKRLDDFNRMLSPVVREGRIQTWSDAEISPSQGWRAGIDRAMMMAKSGLLLVSQAFLDSDFIMNHELPYMLRAREEGRAQLFIAVLDQCMWEHTPIGEIQAAHDAGKPLYELTKQKRDKIIKSICQQLMEHN